MIGGDGNPENAGKDPIGSWINFGIFRPGGEIDVVLSKTNAPEILGADYETLESILIPNGVTKICMELFKDNKNLKSITIPKSVAVIEESVFEECTNLETVTFSNAKESKLAVINVLMFKNCTSLKDIEIPAGVKEIGFGAFWGCTALKTVTFNAYCSPEIIRYGTFEGCVSLNSISLPSSVKNIGGRAFYGCKGLLHSRENPFVIPAGVKELPDETFAGCLSLGAVSFAVNSECEEIGEKVFENCKTLSAVELPLKLKTIKKDAFSGCDLLANAAPNGGLRGVVFDNARSWYKKTSETDTTGVALNVKDPIVNANNLGDNSWLEFGMFNTAEPIPSTMNKENAAVVLDDANWATLENIEIPEGVVIILDDVFKGNTKIKTVTLPKTLQRVSDDLFNGCTNLEKVTFTNTRECQLANISNRMFTGCAKLTEIEIPAAVKYIGLNAFNGCTSLSKVTFNPYNATETISESAFENCRALVNLTLPSSVKEIGASAFSDCANLVGNASNQLIIPANVTKIETYTFYGCKIQTLTFAADSKCEEIGANAFNSCSALSVVQLPKSLKNISKETFHNCITLSTATETNGVKVVFEKLRGWKVNGESVNVSVEWQNAKNLTGTQWYTYGMVNTGGEVPSVMTNANAAEVLENADWQNLTDIVIPEGVTMITEPVFYCKTKIKTVTLPKSLQRVATNLFESCTSLEKVTFSTPRESQLVAISKNMFYGCKKLTEIEIPAGVKEIGESAFYGCTSLKKVTFNPYNATETIGEKAFYNCSALTSITLPSSLKVIGKQAFSYAGLLYTIANPFGIPAMVETIGENAFYDCENLGAVSFANGSKLKTIGQNAFSNCTSLKGITIPEKCTAIQPGAFYGCTGFSANGALGVTFENLSYWYLNSGYTGDAVDVSDKKINAQKIIDDWLSTGLYRDENKVVPSILTSSNADSVLGSGWKTATKIIIPEGVEIIQDALFDNSADLTTSLKEIYFPQSLVKVADKMFCHCQSLETVKFADGCKLSEISYRMFDNCTSLKSIRIPQKTTAIGGLGFWGCEAMKAVDFEGNSSLRSIGDSAFENCGTLIRMELPSGLVYIGKGAFKNCRNWQGPINQVLEIPDGVEEIGEETFSYCESLRTIYIGKKVNKIGRGAFNHLRFKEKWTDPGDDNKQKDYWLAPSIKFLSPEKNSEYPDGWLYLDSGDNWHHVSDDDINKTESHGNGKHFDWNGERFQSSDADSSFDGKNKDKFYYGMRKN